MKFTCQLILSIGLFSLCAGTIFDAKQSATPPDVRGAGLGLSIARRLAEVQGGVLAVTDRVGGGSVFTLTLPAADLPP